jgi:hypothetical protein
LHMQLIMRLDYGSIIPWVRRSEHGISAITGPNALQLYTDVELRGEQLTAVADFTISERQRIPFILVWYPSHLPLPPPIDAEETLGMYGGVRPVLPSGLRPQYLSMPTGPAPASKQWPSSGSAPSVT